VSLTTVLPGFSVLAVTSAPAGGTAREQLIVAAERLFAQRGLQAVSLREIGAAAGQRNNSATQYHFGSKAGLVKAIFALRMEPINDKRLRALADLDARGQGMDLRGLLEAYIDPLAESVDDDGQPRWYVRFLANLFAEPAGSTIRLEHPDHTAGLDEVMRRLVQLLELLPPAVRSERIFALNVLVLNVRASREANLPAAGEERPMALFVADLVDMAVGLLNAPVTSDRDALVTDPETTAPA
jgi:AcrR family transcriptional regulator